jgi:hypothetical protein
MVSFSNKQVLFHFIDLESRAELSSLTSSLLWLSYASAKQRVHISFRVCRLKEGNHEKDLHQQFERVTFCLLV